MIDFLRLAVLLTLAAAAGLGSAIYHRVPLLVDQETYQKVADCKTRAKTTATIELEAFKAHYEGGNLVIDARPYEEFIKGHLNCQMVMNVGPDDVNANFERLFNYQAGPIVIYCTSLTCDLAEELYCKLEPQGFVGMKIYRPGWEDGILRLGLPTVAGPEPDYMGGSAETRTDEESNPTSATTDPAEESGHE